MKKKFKSSSLFGQEKDKSFESSLGAIYQTFDGKDVYPTIQEKAATLLYFIVKNHSFVDGNKRIAAALFICFLHKNGILHRKNGTSRIDNNSLVALTLMIAISKPSEKDAMISVRKTNLKDVLLIKLDAFEDHRGWYLEIYNKKIFHENGIDVKFVQDDISVSHKHVLRGIHGDSETWNLISCLYGKFYLVVVNNNPEAKDYLAWQSFVLSEHNRNQVLVPPNYGNGHLVLSDVAIFHYKQNTYYNPKGQFTILWNDPKCKIWWPVKNPILSKRDEYGKFVD